MAQGEVVAGTILAGKYRVERLIGQGGMGVVVEARHTELDDRVALKFLLPEYGANTDAAARFQREARAAVKIKSPHVARVSDVGKLENGAPYMVMEYLEGVDAAHALAQGQVLPIPEAIDYVVQACDAVADAHAQGIVHRDLKPANLFITRHGDGSPFIKLLDFGISKVVGAGMDNLTRTTATMGSALYMSPEQIRQSKTVDHRTDIYALGITLYEFLTGRQPFIADSFAALCVEVATGVPTPLRELRPDVPQELADVIAKAYARDLSARYQSVGELVAALAPWAPPRSQPIIERIARAAGVIARSPDTDRQSHAALGAASARTNAGGITGGTHMNAAITESGLRRPSSVVPMLAALGGLAVLGAIAIAAFFVVKGRSAEAPATAPSSDPVPATAEPTPAAVPALAPIPTPASAAPAPEPSAKDAPKAAASIKPKSADKPANDKPADKPADKSAATNPPPAPATAPTAPPPPKPKDIEGMR